MQKSHLLFVEDHPDTMAATSLLLERRGYQITRAIDVAQAIALGFRTEFDVLISDVHLPDGKGWDIIHALREVKDFGAIALTADCTAGSQIEQRRNGFDVCLAKPFVFSELLEEIELLAASHLHS